MELDTSHGEKSESYSGSYNPIRQVGPTLEDGHDGKVRSIICRQGCSRDRWLTRDWRKNREAACFKWPRPSATIEACTSLDRRLGSIPVVRGVWVEHLRKPPSSPAIASSRQLAIPSNSTTLSAGTATGCELLRWMLRAKRRPSTLSIQQLRPLASWMCLSITPAMAMYAPWKTPRSPTFGLRSRRIFLVSSS